MNQILLKIPLRVDFTAVFYVVWTIFFVFIFQLRRYFKKYHKRRFKAGAWVRITCSTTSAA